MKKRILTTALGAAALTLGVAGMAPSAHAQAVSFNDYCTWMPRLSAGAAISSATDTQLVAPVSGSQIYVCSVNINQAGGTGTVYLESATAASCAGTLTRLTGTFTANTAAGTTTNFTVPASPGTFVSAGTSNGLCVKSTGTIVQGVTVSYVVR